MSSQPASPSPWQPTSRTAILAVGLVILVALLVWPSFVGRIQYARTRAELAAIRDAAGQAELAAVGKLFTTLVRVVGPAVVQVEATRRIRTLATRSTPSAASIRRRPRMKRLLQG